MFVATLNFKGKQGFIKRGEEVKNPTSDQIKNGLVKELKVKPLEEIKENKPKTKK